MTKDDMQDKRSSQPVLGKFIRREVGADRRRPVEVVKHEFAVIDHESEGYNPYDNAPPPATEAQIEAALCRKALKTRRK